jgi:hypothetical protein
LASEIALVVAAEEVSISDAADKRDLESDPPPRWVKKGSAALPVLMGANDGFRIEVGDTLVPNEDTAEAVPNSNQKAADRLSLIIV